MRTESEKIWSLFEEISGDLKKTKKEIDTLQDIIGKLYTEITTDIIRNNIRTIKKQNLA